MESIVSESGSASVAAFQGQPLDPGEEEVGAGEGGEELGVDGQVAAGEEDALEHPGGPGRDDAVELGGDDARRDRDRQPEQREGDVLGVGVLVLAGGVAGDAREVGRGGVEVPAALEGLGSDGVEGQADAEQPGEPAAGDAGPDDDLGPQDERARGDGERTAAERDLHPATSPTLLLMTFTGEPPASDGPLVIRARSAIQIGSRRGLTSVLSSCYN